MSDVINVPVRYVATDLDPIMQPDPIGAWVRIEEYHSQTDRIEELEAELAEYKHVASAIDKQWAESQDEIADLKAKLSESEALLAKAVEALGEAIYLLDPDEEDIAKETGLHRIVTTYAELTGGKDE